MGVEKSRGLFFRKGLDERLCLRGNAVGLNGKTDEHQVIPFDGFHFLEGKDFPGEPADGVVDRPGDLFRVARLRQVCHQDFHGCPPFRNVVKLIHGILKYFNPLSPSFRRDGLSPPRL